MCESGRKRIIKTKILSNQEVCPDHFVMEVEAPELGEMALPGQFVNVKVSESKIDPFLRIPLGIHSIGEKGIKLLYKVVGSGTRLLSEKQQGEIIDILGPLGNSFNIKELSDNGERVFLVAGGHGIAPLFALCEKLVQKNIKVTFFSGVRTKENLTCIDKLKALGVKVHIASVDGTAGSKGNVTEILEKEIIEEKKQNKQLRIFSCGPRPMLKVLAAIAEQYQVPAQVSLDAYMACGIGVCLGCAIKTTEGYKMVCKDGPVFDARQIIWEEIT